MSDNGETPKEPQTAIVVTFMPDGNVSLNATPDVTLSQYVMAAWLIDRSANELADNSRPKGSPIQVPQRPHIIGRQS